MKPKITTRIEKRDSNNWAVAEIMLPNGEIHGARIKIVSPADETRALSEARKWLAADFNEANNFGCRESLEQQCQGGV